MSIQFSKYFDHTNLKPDVTESGIRQLCREAVEHDFYSVVINPSWVKFAKNELKDSDIKICSVAGFPLGANLTEIKIAESVRLASDGADEIDMVANIGWIKEQRFDLVESEIKAVRSALPYNIILKVIVETALLTELEITESTKCVINGGAQFIKSSTGFFGSADIDSIKIMLDNSDGKISVKASGGIKTLSDCQNYIELGVKRIGSSSSVAIINDKTNR